MYLQESLSKQTIVQTLNYINHCLKIHSADHFKLHLERLKSIIPHKYSMCGLGTIKNQIILVKHTINISFPEAWLDYYFKNSFFNIDPILLNHTALKPMIWSKISGKISDEKSKNIFLKAKEFDLFEGISYGIVDKETNISSIFSLSGFPEKPPLHYITLFEMIVPHLHQTLFRLYEAGMWKKKVQDLNQHQRSALSLRETEILNWIMMGKSNWDISMILNISERTVKFHVSNILKKLDTVSRTHAVAIAIDIGLISM